MNDAGRSRRVVITGIGMINSLGASTDACWSGLLEGRSGVRTVAYTMNFRRPRPNAAPLRFGSSTGVDCDVCVPRPSRPLAPSPHTYTAPVRVRTIECVCPAATITTFARPDTRVGVRRVVVVPSPNWDAPFAPHAHTSPAAVTARL